VRYLVGPRRRGFRTLLSAGLRKILNLMPREVMLMRDSERSLSWSFMLIMVMSDMRMIRVM
jgi:hypothetical protein